MKGRLLCGGPDVWNVFLCEVKERLGDIGVGVDEAVVEVAKAKERLKFFKLLGLGPVCNGS